MELLFFVVLCTLTSVSHGSWDDEQVVKMIVEDTGYAKNCGHSPFNMSWTPKDINPSGTLKINVDYIFAYDFDGGRFNASIYFHGDSEPIFGYADKVTCDDVRKYWPSCPVKKGTHVRFSKTFDVLKATSFPGTYDIKMNVFNNQNQELICLVATITVSPQIDD